MTEYEFEHFNKNKEKKEMSENAEIHVRNFKSSLIISIFLTIIIFIIAGLRHVSHAPIYWECLQVAGWLVLGIITIFQFAAYAENNW